ncbi:MAG: type II toxin-antitoxin system RelE/ParE family toxin [Parvibaculum sp.]
MTGSDATAKVFKTAWFAKAARKERITDDDLCLTIREVMKGQADDLGGGVYKKRLNKNAHRSIILAKGGRYRIYQFLFAKKDCGNIEDDELKDFRIPAKSYAKLSDQEMARLLDEDDLEEICHDGEK